MHLGLFKLSDVSKTSNHADAVSNVVANNETVVLHGSISPISELKAVFRGPRFRAVFYGFVNAFHYPAEVVGMNAAFPKCSVGFGFAGYVPECRHEVFAPPDAISDQIPVPDNVAHGAGDELETVL